MNNMTVIIKINTTPTRLDQALLAALREQKFEEISRNLLKSWFQDRKIQLAGRPVKPSLLLSPGEYEIQLRDLSASAFELDQASASLHPEQIQIVYEDAQLLVLNKASGMPSVPHDSNQTETAVGLALAHFPALAHWAQPTGLGSSGSGSDDSEERGTQGQQGRRSALEPGLLHRLDTGTSGLLVFAKSQQEFKRLTEVWKNREVVKTYRAWVSYSGINFQLQLPMTVTTPLAHPAKSARRMITWSETSHNAIRGQPLPAVTHLIALHSTFGPQAQPTPRPEAYSKLITADLEIRIETGVMHQIRCHLASLGCPIIGDSIYHPLFSSKEPRSEGRGFPRQDEKGTAPTRLWLHAWRLTLPTADGKLLQLEAELPQGWKSSFATRK